MLRAIAAAVPKQRFILSRTALALPRVTQLKGPSAAAALPSSASPFSSSFSSFSALSPSAAPGAMHATTILCVRRDGEVAVVGDGQVSMGSQVVKPNAVKVRRIGSDGKILTGFAGATADCFTLRERLENKIEEYPGQLTRACVELAKNWRMDKYLRRLDAVMLVADKDVSLTVTGTGDVIEPHDGLIAIGSGGSFALAAARALIDQPDLTALEIARKSMTIAADMCVYTNHNFVEELLDTNSEEDNGDKGEDSESSSDDKPESPNDPEFNTEDDVHA